MNYYYNYLQLKTFIFIYRAYYFYTQQELKYYID